MPILYVHNCVLSALAGTRIQTLSSSHLSFKRDKTHIEITEQNAI